MAESADTEPATAAHGNTSHDQDDGPRANLTDPDSRLLKTRTGWVQGYNCQSATSEDQSIIHARATRDSNDLHQFQPTADAVTTLAAHLSTHTGRTNLVVGTMLGDAGYDSHHNLTTPGPDRLIANATRRDLRTRATTNPATGNPPPDASPRQAIDHRLRTPDGHALYTRRSPIAQTPHARLKDRRGPRQLTRRRPTRRPQRTPLHRPRNQPATPTHPRHHHQAPPPAITHPHPAPTPDQPPPRKTDRPGSDNSSSQTPGRQTFNIQGSGRHPVRARPAVDWHDGVPGEPSGDENDPELDLGDTIQIGMELTFPCGATAEADDFWTAARSGEFDAAALAEAGELVTGLGLGRPLHSSISLTNCN
jgi:hypothetical protein